MRDRTWPLVLPLQTNMHLACKLSSINRFKTSVTKHAPDFDEKCLVMKSSGDDVLFERRQIDARRNNTPYFCPETCIPLKTDLMPEFRDCHANLSFKVQALLSRDANAAALSELL